jgi:tRNA pseudouridine13 synthase
MFGPKMLAARDAARALELSVLAETGVEEALFAQGGDLTQGARRALRVALGEFTVELRDDALWVSFALPRGSYASVVMAEVMKSQVAIEGDAED